ncbi:hypothetical protein HLK59_19950 [Streptomyces sp. S3(2020)]|uniref:hypothetical protein n=1 Tax=Streptomyces sp. S3(2020) TaxID=2732044 RepID=UPI0014899D5B|nr:hypothetical protein [Streptomyces sp. S3(2020)]NNN32595.1 hypothetical protein [Streptomyces sp. S3(2020)]
MSDLEVIRALPAADVIRDRSRALAVLDAVMSPEQEGRYFFFSSGWSATEEVASMSDGSGNEYSIVFSAAGVYARGFDHESEMSPYREDPPEPWPGLFDGLPEVFRPYVTEPAFTDEDGTPVVTVCFWRERGDAEWRTGAPEPGAEDHGSTEWLFDVLTDGRPEAYKEFAEDYYEAEVDLDAVRHVYALRPLTQAVVSALNPDVALGDLDKELAQIGYPREQR